MKEYIEREAVIRLIQTEGYNEKYDLGHPKDNDWFCEEVNRIPAADVVEVKRGEWVVIEDLFGEICHCSECGFFMCVNEPGNGLPDVESLKYCPNCGAKMDGGADE